MGLGDFSQRNQPTKVDFLVGTNIVKVASGAYHTLVLTDEGVVYSTGLNDNGQLGHGDLESRKVPTIVEALLTRNVSAVAAGDYASYIVTDAGEVYSWGNNAYQQLGLNIPKVTQRILMPTRIDSLTGLNANIYSIVGGQRTVFAVDQGSDIYAIGNNDFGMLGTGDETQRASPEKVPAFVGENVFQVASGAYHSVAITGCFDLAMPCSGHGRCDGDGKCLCDTGYKGYRCADACPGGVGNACNNNGDCITPLGGSSFCICFAGYIGADCSNECPGGALSTCSGNGICVADGTCQCNTGWSGLNCSTPCPGTKALPCSGLGQCTDGSCKCFLGFAGQNCSTECDGGAYNPCSYNGECQFDGSCKCFKGFRRSDCSCECPGGAENTCFGRGSCNDQCTCDCRTGYRGQNCSVDCPGGFNSWMNGEPVIIHVCSGHGECDAKGECFCDVAWSGDACEIGPPDFTILILIIAAALLGLCCIAGIGSIIRRRKMKIGERERKRQARKKLRSKKKNKGGKSKDRSKRKGKVDK
uniref:EGF-like domain-containing protein n=1 Tax=Hemiselmis andersenii TaxID=464988 RepID=A0A7S1E0E8_HEMAN